ncbi:tRNA (adenosine(37)-N6)-threonylcarbamoyltransferase complex ATPase subunit type 1 TsaE [Aquidulcibacter sp.]|uniref:tRNA (adenosine(37)-N6)-threonylcarbamoyltransferase complex ATPase subunit type 1 TsaE n=1 Tax=Aquidulcibacter sp. TaxID=2052990 RepID=UPI0025B7E21D|nr:tRNA (adenosine(37)-N6)-threonylcarbamoyltransferase complex ATPase subunit type 1 TsaE [Aquidulcibacter sp.]
MMDLLLSFDLATDRDTRELGARLAKVVRAGDCLALRGDLGAGKTSLARGLIRAFLNSDTEVPSPTFTLVQRYQPDPDERPDAPELLHFDLYRLESPDDVWELGWEELDEVISLVEWPDKAGPNLSPRSLDIHILISGDHRRAHLSASPTTTWKSRLNDF